MSVRSPGLFWYHLSTGEAHLAEPAQPEDYDYVDAFYFTIRIALHGRETNDLEWTDDLTERVMDWTYQMDHANDPDNQIKEGGSADVLGIFTGVSPTNQLEDLFIDYQGVWYVRVLIAVPSILTLIGPETYFDFLNVIYDGDADAARRAWDLTTMQIGYGTFSAIATDQPTCEQRFIGGKYWYFDSVRAPTDHPRRLCEGSGEDWHSLPLEPFRAYSETVVKQFRFGVETPAGDYFGGPPPR
jgi:hypothetical protein